MNDNQFRAREYAPGARYKSLGRFGIERKFPLVRHNSRRSGLASEFAKRPLDHDEGYRLSYVTYVALTRISHTHTRARARRYVATVIMNIELRKANDDLTTVINKIFRLAGPGTEERIIL